MQILLVAFFVSLLVTTVLVRSAKVHGHRSGDHDFDKPQGFHFVSVPRIGGLGIVAGLLAAAGAVALSAGAAAGVFMLWLLAAASPAFVAGIVQDFTESIAPRGRLLATALSAVIAFWAVDAQVRATDIPGLDWVVGFTAGSLLVTVVTVAGIANAVNIIDGFNGLASMCVAIMLAAIAYVAFQLDDPLIGGVALAGVGAVLGFFLWNYPAGLIFLGDGGAYFLGFLVAELAVLLVARNPGEISPLFPLLVCIYPVFETLFSVYRRVFLRSGSPSMPDGIHLHSLIYRRFLRWTVGDQRSAKVLTRRNSRTSPFLWVLCSLGVAPAVVFWDSSAAVAASVLLFMLLYLLLYWRIVRFRAPRWLRAWATGPAPLQEGDNRGT